MKINLTKWTAAGVLTLSATAAFAGSITQPGETAGLAAGTPLPPGFYFIDTTDWGVRDGQPLGSKTAVGVTIPIIAWSTPWKILGARLSFLAATPAVEAGNTANIFPYSEGMYNPAAAAKLTWDLGGGFGFGYAIGGYARVNTPVSHDTNTFFQAFALSYTANGWNLTGNLIWGINGTQVGNTASISNPNPDYVNLDLTATKRFGKWELGAVGFWSSDVSDPFPGYHRQSQFALGGLVGYNFGPLTMQTYLTRDVSESNYGGFDTRIWSRVIIPLGDPFAPAPASGPMYRK
jgi:hypothetical protein